MPDEQSAFIYNDQELLEAAKSIDPKILSHFRLTIPYRDFFQLIQRIPAGTL